MEALSPTAMVNSDRAEVREFAALHSSTKAPDIDNAVTLYYAVRDGFRYDPYSIDLSEAGLCATHVLETGRGWCVNKAVLLAASCRAIGIPAQLGYADVRNHLSTERMRKQMGTDLFVWHGYTAILLDGEWVKATPAFNVELCEKFRLKPLEFNGRNDSIYHPYDLDGQKHMEYVNFRGEFADVPLQQIIDDMQRYYPKLDNSDLNGDFDSEVAAEIN
ncbi:MAG: transglutaminase-like putative cysteine protease [Gammaproteobacteria bacterium]|jgi:transglutaminase-like putative cysteine protease